MLCKNIHYTLNFPLLVLMLAHVLAMATMPLVFFMVCPLFLHSEHLLCSCLREIRKGLSSSLKTPDLNRNMEGKKVRAAFDLTPCANTEEKAQRKEGIYAG